MNHRTQIELLPTPCGQPQVIAYFWDVPGGSRVRLMAINRNGPLDTDIADAVLQGSLSQHLASRPRILCRMHHEPKEVLGPWRGAFVGQSALIGEFYASGMEVWTPCCEGGPHLGHDAMLSMLTKRPTTG